MRVVATILLWAGLLVIAAAMVTLALHFISLYWFRSNRHEYLDWSTGFILLQMPFIMLALLLGRVKLRQPKTGHPRVFVSYNHKDLEQAESVRTKLAAVGCDVELLDIDLGIKDDAAVRKLLIDRIRAVDLVVCIFTPQSRRSDWVQFERDFADQQLACLIHLYAGVSRARSAIATYMMRSHSFRLTGISRSMRRNLSMLTHDWDLLIASYARYAAALRRAGLPGRVQAAAKGAVTGDLFVMWEETSILRTPPSRGALAYHVFAEIFYAFIPAMLPFTIWFPVVVLTFPQN